MYVAFEIGQSINSEEHAQTPHHMGDQYTKKNVTLECTAASDIMIIVGAVVNYCQSLKNYIKN